MAAALVLTQPLAARGPQGGKSKLKVLYVGGAPDHDTFGRDTTGMAADVAVRMAAFERMLDEYFDDVTVVHSDGYTPAMSGGYDVTVMDGTPRQIAPAVMGTAANGKKVEVSPASYLPLDFDRPMLIIGELGEPLGRSLGLKIDWYCLCLDADALEVRTGHPIFKGPFPLTMTFAEKPTPEHAFSYPYYSDGPIPDSLPMWRVQKEGYSADRTLRAGLVARGWGFEDSPDAEVISGGVSQKSLDAVAIGRHGNFLHWGFAASPDNLTDEGHTALANAIVYISQFAGKGIIARKTDERQLTRDYLKQLKYGYTRESYERRVRANKQMDDMYVEWRQVSRAKMERGEAVTEREREAANYVSPPVMSRGDYIKAISPHDLFECFGEDAQKYIAFYDDNRDYFHSVLHGGGYRLEVDEDARSLGIPNNDKRLIDRAITMLETGDDTARARRILARYTLEEHETPAEWREWYDRYEDRLFFTESGGWLFLVDSREPGLNDYSVLLRRAVTDAAEYAQGVTSDAEPVAVSAAVVPSNGGGYVLNITVVIHPGYHIYGDIADADPYIPTEIEVTLPDGFTPKGTLGRPLAIPYGSSGTTVYEGTAVFTQEFIGSGSGEIECRISYQCCDLNICFPPVEKIISVKANLP